MTQTEIDKEMLKEFSGLHLGLLTEKELEALQRLLANGVAVKEEWPYPSVKPN